MSDVPTTIQDLEAGASAVSRYLCRYEFHAELEQIHRLREEFDAAEQEHQAAVACLRAWERNKDGAAPDRWERSPVTPYYPERRVSEERG